jgi:hypothetical protein
MIAYRCWTHDLRPPVRGGDPVSGWDGSCPFVLPPVRVDRTGSECAAGYSACERPETALRISGLWPDGRPSRLFVVDSGRRKVEHRKEKVRAASWTVVRECSAEEVAAAVLGLSVAFGQHAERMAAEQIAWRDALARPGHDPAAVEAGLRTALERRRIGAWSLRRYDSARAAWDAWDAFDAWAAWAARDAWAAWDAWAARAARAARAAWAARAAFDAWDARAAFDAWDARAAWDALTATYASLSSWVDRPADLLTAGLREAYRSGLGVALPTGPSEMGWAMDEEVYDA